MQKWIEQATHDVRVFFESDSTGHDFAHIERVRSMALRLADIEHADKAEVELTAILHDYGDEKFYATKEDGGAALRQWLDQTTLLPEQKDRIETAIRTVGFKGGTNESPKTLLAKIVQDADRLDAIGAIGIARTFMYAGATGSKMHEDKQQIRDAMTAEEYRDGTSTATQHMHEKLLKLKDLMQTKAGKQEAEKRHQFMLDFLEQFNKEWNRGN
ncbi:HD domain-containing protein [Paenalkalicoccus suaedae]|uniref:HD domain-containing protein n=1 Tax=Paenalkalicoccus suaedae TaxID=2592382 RepID=A0A859FGF8_9BACI|nr:HD domain-containing protein [Paenalkalicoccus suaedae]QKS71316.1 HD domain-containing protein [Paenalkalicoccus suaedae]